MIVVDTNTIAYLYLPSRYTADVARVLEKDASWAVQCAVGLPSAAAPVPGDHSHAGRIRGRWHGLNLGISNYGRKGGS